MAVLRQSLVEDELECVCHGMPSKVESLGKSEKEMKWSVDETRCVA